MHMDLIASRRHEPSLPSFEIPFCNCSGSFHAHKNQVMRQSALESNRRLRLQPFDTKIRASQQLVAPTGKRHRACVVFVWPQTGNVDGMIEMQVAAAPKIKKPVRDV